MTSASTPRLLAQTDDWWVVDKPAHWLTIPGRSERPVVVEWVRQQHGDCWVVHRLDEETSGVLLFARSEAAHRRACDWFATHAVKKVYEFLASGLPRLPVFRADHLIEDKPSTTQVEVIERFKALSEPAFLGRARPVTGRRHQIRIHLAQAGHSLWGDPRYGGAKMVRLDEGRQLSVGRVALHARSLALPTGEVFESPWPADFSEWVEACRK